MAEINKQKIMAGRDAVDAYRRAHTQLHSKPWHKGIPEDHTALLEKLVSDLENTGIASAELDFEPKKTEVLAKFWADSDEQNIQELGFEGKELTGADREALMEKWH